MKVKSPVEANAQAPVMSTQLPVSVLPESAPNAALSAAASQEEMHREWKRHRELHELPQRQILRGAAALFRGMGVSFPPNLLDANNPNNDPKYMRLLAAVLGLDELSEYFHTASEEDDDSDTEEHSDATELLPNHRKAEK